MFNILGHFEPVLLVVTKYLLNVNYIRAGIPSEPIAIDIPISAFCLWYSLYGWECRNRHYHYSAVLEVNAHSGTIIRKGNILYLWYDIPITFYHVFIFLSLLQAYPA